MLHHFQPIPEWHDVDAAVFANEIVPRYRPAVLKGLVRSWPVVQHGLRAPDAICDYFSALDNGTDVEAMLIPAKYGRRQFYTDDMNGFTTTRATVPIARVIDQLRRYALLDSPPTVAIQGAPINACMPQFLAENPLPLLDATISPRLWLGNAMIVPTHLDEMSNIACVASGRRRFTLFPPDQISNLYIGPLEFTPTGPPVSLVSLHEPDFERFPRFQSALDTALSAELEPGDAIYIPPFWWHHVESLAQFNTLINYWWKTPTQAKHTASTIADCLYYCLLTIKDLPIEQREAVGSLFHHYLFNPDSEPAEHIPAHRRGLLGDLPPEFARQVQEYLARGLLR